MEHAVTTGRPYPEERLGSYVGWRIWRVELYRSRRRGIREPYLISPLRCDRWERPVMYAPCTAAAGAWSRAPRPKHGEAATGRQHDFTCECGIYALRLPSDCVAAIRLMHLADRPLLWVWERLRPLIAARRGLRAAHILGSVELWGRVVVGDEGYRAEYAQPRVLYVPEGERWASALAAKYECRVVEVPSARWGSRAILSDLADEDRWLSHLEPWRIHEGRPGAADALDLELRQLLNRGAT